MTFISVTRLRLRSLRFLPLFAIHALRASRQVRRAAGYRHGSVFGDGLRTFWTVSAWDGEAAMRAYMTAGAHRAAMPRLMHWCDEASVVHWLQEGDALPAPPEAERRMRSEGRPSKVKRPSLHHAAMSFAPLRRGRPASLPRSAASDFP